jgi:hypothetical protein
MRDASHPSTEEEKMAETPRVQSAQHLAVRIAQDPELERRIKDNPVAAVAEIAGDPLTSDPLIYRVVVIVLGVVLLVATVGALVLTAYNLDIPDLLTALGSAAVGALAGVLTPLGGSRSQ